jgi:leucyl-tRNA synthetase
MSEQDVLDIINTIDIIDIVDDNNDNDNENEKEREKPIINKSGKWDNRDKLIANERRVQSKWNLHVDADTTKPKKFITFPYMYSNSVPHLGHAYTLTKADFTSRFLSSCGYNVLYPCAFHCSGMPIVACADRLKTELHDLNPSSKELINPTLEQVQTLNDKSQIQISLKSGITIDQLKDFADPLYWLKYFPVQSELDLAAFGLSADFTRSFITTDVNPYYDSFIKWQFSIINSLGFLKFGKRYSIYSIKDKQPCADHDRAIGNDVEPIKRTLTKLHINHKSNSVFKYEQTDNIYFLHEITNIKYFVEKNVLMLEPNTVYGIFEHNDNIYVTPSHLILCALHQYEGSKFIPDVKYTSNDFVDTEVDMFIDKTKYKTFKLCIKNTNTNIKPETKNSSDIETELARKYEIMVKTVNYPKPFDIINFTEYFKTYLETKSNAMSIYEPEKPVISRSGDVCIVALCDQWYINYSDPTLKERVNNYITTKLETFDPVVKNKLLIASNWINEWPCSRNYGLGTKLLDTEYVIDSLSDSTIYMAYYTVAHLITKFPLDKLSYEIWDFIFRNGPSDKFINNLTKSEVELLNKMHIEFKYWYPVDLRVSGKDLVSNHLVMALYNHAMVWPEEMWPRAYFVNGHIMLNREKMSKSTGNFMTLRHAIDTYSADAVRLCLAMAGSYTGDADFEESHANAQLMRLTKEREWCFEILKQISELKNKKDTSTKNNKFWETVFENEINKCMYDSYEHYENMDFRRVISNGFFALIHIRDKYKIMTTHLEPNTILYLKFIESYLMLLYPICPHWCEEIWTYSKSLGLKFEKRYIKSNYKAPDANKYRYYMNILEDVQNKVRNSHQTLTKKNKLQKDNLSLIIEVYEFSTLELEIIKSVIQLSKNNLPTNEEDWKKLCEEYKKTIIDKKNIGTYSKFVSYLKENVLQYSEKWIDWNLDVDTEHDLFNDWFGMMVAELNLKEIIVKKIENNKTPFKNSPGVPNIIFKNI